MGSIVSSKLDFLNKNPDANVSLAEIDHEVTHIRKREQLGALVTVASAVLLMLSLAAVISGGMFLVGAFAAMAIFGAAYTLCCREAETALRGKQVQLNGGDPTRLIPREGLLSWF